MSPIEPSYIEILVSVVGLCLALTGSAVWVFRNGLSRIESQNKTTISQLTDSTVTSFNRIETQTKDSMTRMERTSDKIVADLKADFRRLHDHVDEKMGEMYAGVDVKTREIQNHLDRQMSGIHETFRSFQQTLQENREMTHQLDKDLLAMKGDVADKYTKKADFDRLVDQVEELKRGLH